ncbi:MAG: hypothetical protein DRN14_05045 [Thermoplasmata archaeon]|nr:MAG: hypothetical protein DRN14_05045 [Thermoplasmata archaeon]
MTREELEELLAQVIFLKKVLAHIDEERIEEAYAALPQSPHVTRELRDTLLQCLPLLQELKSCLGA